MKEEIQNLKTEVVKIEKKIATVEHFINHMLTILTELKSSNGEILKNLKGISEHILSSKENANMSSSINVEDFQEKVRSLKNNMEEIKKIFK